MQNYINILTWIGESIAPILDQTTKTIAKEGKKNNANTHYGEWWAFFAKNTVALITLIPVEHASCQINMTLRLLLEISADVSFIAMYPENTANLERIHEKVLSGGKKDLSYQYLSENSHKYKLYKFENGKKIRDAIKTEERISIAYGENGDMIYSYLNYYAHLNPMGIILDLVHSQAGLKEVMKERLHLLQSFPLFYEKMVHSIGNLLRSEQLIHYDCSDMRLSIEHLCKKLQYS